MSISDEEGEEWIPRSRAVAVKVIRSAWACSSTFDKIGSTTLSPGKEDYTNILNDSIPRVYRGYDAPSELFRFRTAQNMVIDAQRISPGGQGTPRSVDLSQVLSRPAFDHHTRQAGLRTIGCPTRQANAF